MTSGDNRLPILADEIKQAVADFHQHQKASLASGIAAGEKLIEAKERVLHGQWLPWLKENVAIAERTAQIYMRLAREKEIVTISAGSADLTIEAAIEVAQNLKLRETLAKKINEHWAQAREGTASLVIFLADARRHLSGKGGDDAFKAWLVENVPLLGAGCGDRVVELLNAERYDPDAWGDFLLDRVEIGIDVLAARSTP